MFTRPHFAVMCADEMPVNGQLQRFMAHSPAARVHEFELMLAQTLWRELTEEATTEIH